MDGPGLLSDTCRFLLERWLLMGLRAWHWQLAGGWKGFRCIGCVSAARGIGRQGE